MKSSWFYQHPNTPCCVDIGAVVSKTWGPILIVYGTWR